MCIMPFRTDHRTYAKPIPFPLRRIQTASFPDTLLRGLLSPLRLPPRRGSPLPRGRKFLRGVHQKHAGIGGLHHSHISSEETVRQTRPVLLDGRRLLQDVWREPVFGAARFRGVRGLMHPSSLPACLPYVQPANRLDELFHPSRILSAFPGLADLQHFLRIRYTGVLHLWPNLVI